MYVRQSAGKRRRQERAEQGPAAEEHDALAPKRAS